jgi:hypothetical protein
MSMSEDQRQAIHEGLQMLASACDGAQRRDCAGYGRYDTEFGHSLAAQVSLSDRQAECGLRLLRRYRRQLPFDVLLRAGAVDLPTVRIAEI